METITKEKPEVGQKPASVSGTDGKDQSVVTPVKKEVKEEPLRYKDVTLKAARTFATLPPQVQEETRTRVGAFALPGETIAYRSLSDEELKLYGQKLIGASPNNPNYEQKVNEYFNDFAINLPTYGEGVEISVPVNSKGEVVLNDKTAKDVFAIMRYRHMTNHPRVAQSYAQFEEAPQFYIAYIIDRKLLKRDSIEGKNVRKQADRLYLEMMLEENATKLSWILELARRGVKTTNLQDPPEGYTPSSLRGVRNISSLDVDERELAIEEFKNQRPVEFVDLVQDPDLEWKALLERMVALGVLIRKGNVVMNDHEAVGSDDEEAIARMKSSEYSQNLVALKAKMKNADKSIKI